MADVFTYSVEENLIAEIAKRPVLYQVKTKSFKDTVAKDNNWLEIEKVLNIKVEELKKRWKTIRDYYVRNSKKKPTGSQAKKKRVDERRTRSLSFLENYSLARSTYTNLPEDNGQCNVPESSSNSSKVPSFSEEEEFFSYTVVYDSPDAGEDTHPGEGSATQDPGEGTSTQDPGEGTSTQDPGEGTSTQDPGEETDSRSELRAGTEKGLSWI
ncbi:hypothetical protein JTE90_008664 [Oedothorax gibbosus]|uniref:MADF domain-containing protein n=1 Tax=Oedothorax gibbosus TaxID=931172 RepID=A0AAV6TZG7_9ARAC|nr:hypothetical protein JTE90_008664 [Oedothorax gibbosus]